MLQGEKGAVTVFEEERHGLSDGDFVRFEEIEGMTQLNSTRDEEAQPIKVTSPYSFEIGDTSKFNDYTGKGLFFQVKQGAKLSFNTLEELLAMPKDVIYASYPKVPKILQTDFVKNPFEQHLFYLALQEFRENNNNKYPLPTTDDDAKQVFKLFTDLCNKHDVDCKDDDGKLSLKYKELARSSSAIINPMCAFLGGIVGQEILKACSHKFTPIQQLLYFDAFECLPKPTEYNNNYDEFKPVGNRYDDNIAVFGKSIQDKVLKSKMFLVGAGAIGCEMLKNWALMGVGCDINKEGQIIVTDMDQIERSNLNRQFLFRKSDIGSAKSVAAAASVRVMNKDINIIPQENRVGKDSENVYNFDFWSNLNAVCTALDNVQARLYVDAQCVYYNKPLLESGTLGTKGNTQIVVPKMTQSYGSTRDPDEKGVPICTLKNFPNKIEHTIQWARDDFEGEFTQIIVEINGYLENDKYLQELHKNNASEELSILKNIQKNLESDKAKKGQRPLNFQDCVNWARNKFQADYSNQIRKLLYNFPHDSKTTEGALFWSPPKRAPFDIKFNENDELHIGYIIAAANLRAYVYGLKGITDIEEIKKLLKNCIVEPYDPAADKNKIAALDDNDEADNDKDKKPKEEDKEDEDELKNITESLPDRKELIGMKLKVIEFEKDDDTNFHMDFIQCAANLRARNYRIAEKTKHEIKKIAGKIIPAIATTTALVTGLISLEFYKLIQSDNKVIEDYRSSYVNLALPLVTMSEPVPAQQTTIYKKGKEWNYTLWDVIEIKNNKDMTVAQFIKYFDDEWDCDLNMISYGNAMIYAFYMNAMKLMKRKKMKLFDLVEEVCGKLDKNTKVLQFEVNCDYNDESLGDEPLLPTVALYL